MVVVSTRPDGNYSLGLDGVTRTIVNANHSAAGDVANLTNFSSLRICAVHESVGGTIQLGVPTSNTSHDCKTKYPFLGTFWLANPPLVMSNETANATVHLDAANATLEPLATLPDARLLVAAAELPPCTTTHVEYEGETFAHDPRLQLLENTVEAPASGLVAAASAAGGTVANACPSVVKTRFNKAGCVVTDTCSPIAYSSSLFTLDDARLRQFYTVGHTYVYSVDALRLEDDYAVSPCDGGISRWRRIGDTCSSTTALDSETLASLAAAFAASHDTNAHVRDVIVSQGNCTSLLDGVSTLGATIAVAGGCWQHVHPATLNVYDFALWTLSHPGSATGASQSVRIRNPITAVAETGSSTLYLPHHHLMYQWGEGERLLGRGLLGRLGDQVDFAALPTSVQSPEMAALVGASGTSLVGGAEACGSEGEVANEPERDHFFKIWTTAFENGLDALYRDYQTGTGKKSVWLEIAVHGADQLRQRVAWALSQVIVTGEEGLTAAKVVQTATEAYTSYYDIMVRHGFGSFEALLREVSYSPVMAKFLTFFRNQGLVGSGSFPDENYAREIMQLFSIGMFTLHRNGSQVLNDLTGEPLQTYDNDDIMDFARAWTGFDSQPQRGGLEQCGEASCSRAVENWVDPMAIKPDWRDTFPKMDLHDGYIGDGYPLCSELPPQPFLRKGARYRFLGYSDTPVETADSGAKLSDWDSNYWGANLTLPNPPHHLMLSPSSALWPLLCAPDAQQGGACAFASDVVLAQNYACFGGECDLDTLALVNVTANGKTVYYEHVRVACVEFPFFEGGMQAALKRSTATSHQNFCANPATAVAGASCVSYPWSSYQIGVCNVFGELMRFETAKERCREISSPGDYWYMRFRHDWTSGCGLHKMMAWLERPCLVQVQVRASGRVSIVHNPTKSSVNLQHYAPDSLNVFRVRWKDGRFPTADAGCTTGCAVHGDSCLCNVTLATTPVVADGDTIPPSTLLDRLLGLGSAPPDVFDVGVYTQCTSAACNGTDAEVWTTRANGRIEADTIFKVTRNGTYDVFLANRESTVRVSADARFEFRNPPQFMETITRNAASRDAEYETDAVLRHITTHQNVPPFYAKLLIQRLVSSNPSPRYIEAAATAFATGTYTDGGVSFGGGAYGDLGAMVAAILLDREARSTELDADPTFGQLREPMLKLVHLLRAMEYNATDARLLSLQYDYTKEWIGQQPYGSPTVFNFFLPDYQPAGAVADAGLVSPEAQLGTTPMVLSVLNGMMRLVRDGLSSCKKGHGGIFGPANDWKTDQDCSSQAGRLRTADGHLDFAPESTSPADVVTELGLLLTAGRLSNHSHSLLTEEWQRALDRPDDLGEPLKHVQRLVLATPEFHATNLIRPLVNESRQPPADQRGCNASEEYKAVVVLFLSGGLDSHNLFVPHSGCDPSATVDLRDDYETIRGSVALPKSTLHLFNVTPGTQPCDTWGLHPQLPFLHQLYQEDDLAFIAGIGPLVQPVTKRNWNRLPQPHQLFAHNAQQACAHNVHAQALNADGVLGRIAKTLAQRDGGSGSGDPRLTVGSYSIKGNQKILESNGVLPNVLKTNGQIPEFVFHDEHAEAVVNLTRPRASSIFGETISAQISSALIMNRELKTILDDANVSQAFLDAAELHEASLTQQLVQVAKVIDRRGAMCADRDVFLVHLGGLDTHTDEHETLTAEFGYVNEAIEAFTAEMITAEMKAKGVWDKVVIASISDFGRTLTSNGRGRPCGAASRSGLA